MATARVKRALEEWRPDKIVRVDFVAAAVAEVHVELDFGDGTLPASCGGSARVSTGLRRRPTSWGTGTCTRRGHGRCSTRRATRATRIGNGPSATPQRRNPRASRGSVPMELVGLEPTTSCMPSKELRRQNTHYVQDFCRGRVVASWAARITADYRGLSGFQALLGFECLAADAALVWP
jgi:hypothetical protein